jgi:hypothetical protein
MFSALFFLLVACATADRSIHTMLVIGDWGIRTRGMINTANVMLAAAAERKPFVVLNVGDSFYKVFKLHSLIHT